MPMRKREESTVDKHLVKALAHLYVQRMQQGENITIISLLEELLNSLMLAQRKLYLCQRVLPQGFEIDHGQS